ncbi:hypothetical protein KC19_12G099600 [Ceratodon purpureus]|uniref:PQ-loop repeat family protein / transmembrane family protein n=1 Tax=Ceratodon purpureus TaxID=3225 RepID=A0A8T0G6K1_CERPU|nr:hypothetical protein KC19_12G099600 [Ceratodon purpureus]
MEGPLADFCPAEKNCLKWVETFLKDCVCSRRDQVSLILGLMSVFSWGIAEVPQIITNFKNQSTHGVSLLFVSTWVVGDLFNVAGCYLEPATLPTQLYMALLYTITTTILVGQSVYYGYIQHWFRSRPSEGYPEATPPDAEAQRPVDTTAEGAAEPTIIRVPTSSRELYFTSARSLASSYTPTLGSYNLVGSHGGSYLDSHDQHSSSYLLAPNSLSALPSEPVRRGEGRKSSPASSILRMAASAGTLVVGSVGLSSQMSRSKGSGLIALASTTMVIQRVLGEDISVKGEVFGWIMAAIYMGGRVPQIRLNIQRGTAEGLNPLMFTFALIGNLTYVGSILVRSMAWSQLKPNLPWLVDAVVCVLLDSFVSFHDHIIFWLYMCTYEFSFLGCYRLELCRYLLSCVS